MHRFYRTLAPLKYEMDINIYGKIHHNEKR